MFEMFNRQPSENTRTYYAKSLFSDPVSLLALAIIITQQDRYKYRMPDAAEEWIADILGWAILITRFLFTERPVAIIPPGDAKPVEVKRIDEKEGK